MWYLNDSLSDYRAVNEKKMWTRNQINVNKNNRKWDTKTTESTDVYNDSVATNYDSDSNSNKNDKSKNNDNNNNISDEAKQEI